AHAGGSPSPSLRVARRGPRLPDRRRGPPARGRAMTLHDAWTALRHGGNLLSPGALEALPQPPAPRRDLADRLRAALVALEPEKPAAASVSALLDTVLEEVCGLHDGWRKGNDLGTADAEKLLDGTAVRPRRLRAGPGID